MSLASRRDMAALFASRALGVDQRRREVRHHFAVGVEGRRSSRPWVARGGPL